MIASIPPANAGGVYQEPDAFISQVFDNAPTKPQVLWLNKELKAQIVDILDHKYKGLSLIHISEPTRPTRASRMPSSA